MESGKITINILFKNYEQNTFFIEILVQKNIDIYHFINIIGILDSL